MAWEEGKLSADITEEQRKVTEADLIVFQVQLAADALFVFRAQRLKFYFLCLAVPHLLAECSCYHEGLD